MPDISYELEALSAEFATKVGVARDEVITAFHTALEDMTPEERLVCLDSMSISGAMTTKLTAAMKIYEPGIRRSLEATFTTATLPETSLTALFNQAKRRISVEVTQHLSNEMMDAIIEGMATNKFPSQIIKGLDITMPKYQIETLINTTFNQFNNALINQIAEALPSNTKFMYIGPYDEKTRGECVERIKMSPATFKEIKNSKFGNMNNAIWNCRHKWEQMSDDVASQGFNLDKELSNA